MGCPSRPVRPEEAKIGVTPIPDVVLLAAGWRPRALLRAQLIEQGFDVVAVDSWLMMRKALRPHVRPPLAVVDLQELPEPEHVLNDLAMMMEPGRVLVVTATGAVTPDEIQARGYRVLRRPISIGEIAAAVDGALYDAGDRRRLGR
jgi:hypothetical protein